MKKILKELKLIINKELYQKGKITFEEFKLANEKRMKEQEIAKICKALGDENRVKIIKLLSNGELCACKLLEEFKISQSTLSHHMKILTDCNLVDFKKDGKWVHYSINTKAFSEFKKEIKILTGKKK